MINKYQAFPGAFYDFRDIPCQPDWLIRYRECAVLTNIDGYIIIYNQQCHITLRTSLTDAQKHTTLCQFMEFLSDTVPPMRHIMLWSVGETLVTLQDRACGKGST